MFVDGWSRRYLIILPEEAGTEAVPHRLAKEASRRSRSGLSPATIRSAAVSDLTPSSSTRLSDARFTRHRICSRRLPIHPTSLAAPSISFGFN